MGEQMQRVLHLLVGGLSKGRCGLGKRSLSFPTWKRYKCCLCTLQRFKDLAPDAGLMLDFMACTIHNDFL